MTDAWFKLADHPGGDETSWNSVLDEFVPTIQKYCWNGDEETR